MPAWKVALALAVVALAAGRCAAVSPSQEELAVARRWAAAKFDGLTQAQPPGPYSTNAPFSFICDGRPSTEFLESWKLERTARKLDPQRTQYTLAWTDPRATLQVRCIAIQYHDFPTVEWTLYIKNTGTNDSPLLEDIQALDTRFQGNATGQFVLYHNTGDNCAPDAYQPHELVLAPKSEHRFAPAGGRPTSVGFPYFNLAWGGQGVIAVVGWPGQWAAQFTRREAGAVRIRGGQELTHFKLHPGEEIRTPLIALQFWKGDHVHAQNVWRRWMLAHNLPRAADGKLLPPIFTSCSGGFFPGIQCTEASERQFISAFIGAGIKLDYWWVDAGWYPCNGNWAAVGTWTPDLARFPHGLRAVSDYAHANAAGLIVWFEPERVTPGTWLYTNHPAWLLGRDGDQKLLNLGNEEARRWLTDHVDGLLTSQGIDFYRQDFNIDPLPYWRANDSPDRQGITEIRHIEGYLAYWDELRRRHPGLHIDSCASGGRRNNLETLRRAVPLLRSDYQAFDGNPAYAPGNQGHTYGLSSWIPYYGQGVYFSHRHFLYSARSYLSPAFAIAADVRKPDIDWPLIRRAYKQWCEVADCFLGDFYPLTPYHLEDDVWLAWQFDLPDAGKGMVQAFRRARSPYTSATFRLRGLDPQGRYSIRNLDEERSGQEFSGLELMQAGLKIRIPMPAQAVLFAYRKLR